MTYYLYILQCADNSLYTGITPNIENRLRIHAEGKGSKYVRSRLPVRLIYQEPHPDKNTALAREYEVKSWNRAAKISKLKLDIDL